MNLGHMIRMSKDFSCGYGRCKARFDRPWIIGKYPDLEPNPEIAMHWYQTHGFPIEDFVSEWYRITHGDCPDEFMDRLIATGEKRLGDATRMLLAESK